MHTKLIRYSLTLTVVTSVTIRLTLVCLIAVVGEVVGTAAHQTQLVGETGRAALRSHHLAPEVHMPDSEGGARLLRGTAGITVDAVYHEEDQARKRQQQRNGVPHVTCGLQSVGEAERGRWSEAKEIQRGIIMLINEKTAIACWQALKGLTGFGEG